jgi:flagellar biosynthesis GTPase FlhF
VAANDESEREAAELAEREAAERQATEREEAERETASAQDAERERQAAQEQRERRMREEAEAEARNVEEPPAAVDGPPGFINVQSTPPARIVIDGSDTGMTTPANGIQLSSGIRHRVELINEATDLHRTYRISLEPGQVRNIVNRSN